VLLTNVFHAGDGNLHPNISYDGRDAAQTARTVAAGHEILQLCVDLGGSISGEHGIGSEKLDHVGMMFGPNDLDVMARVRRVFNPDGLCNPGKVLPTRNACAEPAKWPQMVARVLPTTRVTHDERASHALCAIATTRPELRRAPRVAVRLSAAGTRRRPRAGVRCTSTSRARRSHRSTRDQTCSVMRRAPQELARRSPRRPRAAVPGGGTIGGCSRAIRSGAATPAGLAAHAAARHGSRARRWHGAQARRARREERRRLRRAQAVVGSTGPAVRGHALHLRLRPRPRAERGSRARGLDQRRALALFLALRALPIPPAMLLLRADRTGSKWRPDRGPRFVVARCCVPTRSRQRPRLARPTSTRRRLARSSRASCCRADCRRCSPRPAGGPAVHGGGRSS
jgi:hypothetical protein